MQYVLTQNEYDGLITKKFHNEEIAKRERILSHCFKLLQPDFCPYKSADDSDEYCDDCPLDKFDEDGQIFKRILCKYKKIYSK